MTATVETVQAFWMPTRRLTLTQARRRSDLVKFLRMIFTAGAAISAGFFIGYLVQSAFQQSSVQEVSAAETVTMLNPRFTGRDELGEPYLITADSAQRQRDNFDLIDLVNPSLEDGFNGNVRAPRGVFDQVGQTIELFDQVVVTDTNGNRFETSHAEVFIQESRVVGIQPLVGDGPIGKLRSDTYEVQDGGDRIILRGNVWTELNPG